MIKNKTLEKLMRFLITVLGAGLGAALGALILSAIYRWQPEIAANHSPVLIYLALCFTGAIVFFFLSAGIIKRTMKLISIIEHHWDSMPTQQIMLTTFGLIMGLAVAALLTQLILSAGASLATVTFSALTYVVIGYIGMQIGYRRYNSSSKRLSKLRKRLQKHGASSLIDDSSFLLDDDDEADDDPTLKPAGAPSKLLDTSVIIDGRILDIVKTGFIEGDLIVPEFVLAELRHIADSGDSLRRARGRRGLDVLTKLQQELKNPIIINETDYHDIDEVDVKLLRLCRDLGATVVTNDYNLNKVAGVTGISVLNINDLANAIKPMLMAGEELTVQIVREGKEPGQGVAYLDDGTMIVVENGRRYVGESAAVVVTTVLQTSAGRMIFTKLKTMDEKAG